ncbi:ribonuclease HII [Nesterenkonia sp. AY15]|uniref:ribonuclease HII n=1 Tax=Nesterenkonia sp. AY15 TaxID=2901139 RepID=UPI001F4CB859|nr:ribonuclease HII [Nesterenkonia sp. AY15]MCH8571301.1 ribonuclease HII [Nesterenkonia sp. AY15]
MPENATLLPELGIAAGRDVRYIAGIDEVGRGALAGPVSIGVVVFDLQAPVFAQTPTTSGICTQLDGVRDSKLLSAKARQRWHPHICEHAAAYSVQHRAPREIDALGINGALRAAGLAGLNAVEVKLGRPLDAVILDGSHDWLTHGASPRVQTMVKADIKALTVACASVLAKLERDRLMEELAAEHPGYGWDSNRGYGSQGHRNALLELGATAQHRLSWNLGV